MEGENIHNKIKELLGQLPDKLAIIEEPIPMETQILYFDSSKRFKNNFDKSEILNSANLLALPEVPETEKKEILAKLASIDAPEAFRFIEKFHSTAENDLKDWAKLALLENRMLLESIFLDQNQILISSGLGGKENKLRYFIVVFLNDDFDFDETRKKVVNNEFEPVLSSLNCELEILKFYKYYLTLTVLIPLEVSIKNAFSRAISECNQYGEFLSENFIVTNVKVLSSSEIRSLQNRKQKKNEK
jgi:hypothetical protein